MGYSFLEGLLVLLFLFGVIKMDKNGIITKLVYGSTEEGINTQTRLQYNTHTDHIGFTIHIQKSPGFVSGIINNKNCANYLGITIAEQLLAKIFKNVEVMPHNNPGFDFKCNHGYMIDVKSATKNKKYDNWLFSINRNQIADYFLCLAFDNRQNLNPLHVWLIPSKEINHLRSLTISKSTIDKWSKFELTDKLDKVIGCCNIMKEA